LDINKNSEDKDHEAQISLLIKQTIQEEYKKCKIHFKSLNKLDPSPESATQIERDLGRTFPINPYFKIGENGYVKLRNVLRAFACYDT
jgi:hypothetical protein